MPEYFPALLFASSGALCLALAIAEWNGRRRLALSSLALGGFSLICFAANHAWARYSRWVEACRLRGTHSRFIVRKSKAHGRWRYLMKEIASFGTRRPAAKI